MQPCYIHVYTLYKIIIIIMKKKLAGTLDDADTHGRVVSCDVMAHYCLIVLCIAHAHTRHEW